jgi:uncharacterized membrane protein YfcA
VYLAKMAVMLASFLPDNVEWVRFMLLGTAAVMLLGAAKAGFGGGIGILSTPLMFYACSGDSKLALGLMLPLLVACDYVSLPMWWRRWDMRNVLLLLPGMTLGLLAGWLGLWLFQRYGGGTGGAKHETTNQIMSLSMGLIAVLFVGLYFLRQWRGALPAFRPKLSHALGIGSAAGFTSTLAHAAGPIVTMYLLPQQMPKDRFVGTTVLYYWIGNQAKLPIYAVLGMLSLPAMKASAALLPAVVAGALLGFFLHHKVNEKHFAGVVQLLLLLVGIDMTVRSAIGLMR